MALPERATPTSPSMVFHAVLTHHAAIAWLADRVVHLKFLPVN